MRLHPQLLSRTNPYSPLGSDEGAAIAHRYSEWRVQGHTPNAFFPEALRVWEINESGLDALSPEEVQNRFIQGDEAPMLFDFTVIAVAFCQLIEEGYVHVADRDRAFKAILRQSYLCVDEMGWTDPTYRREMLVIAGAALLAAPARA